MPNWPLALVCLFCDFCCTDKMSGRCSDREQSLKTKYSQAGSAQRLLLGLLTDQVQVTVLHTDRLTLCTSVNLPGERGHVSSPVEQHR